ncbi:hypothetical protein FA13DRAFT_1621264 [Coprinellus micaceus]|uniref:Uncharacterized protein n=1 Tax=Coprinellus micaceus TaxID=71717 RepID=A0A4Y7TUW3_COPMI|nr:hypothetical protein FA13DRAFT_1621264 [Coprinellus micaceus]
MGHESGEMAQWVKEQFEGLFGRPERDGESLQKTLANSFAHFPKITYNDKQIDLSEFKEQLETSRFAVQQVEIEWPQISEHPAQDKHDGVVFGSFNVKRLSKIRIRAGPAEHRQSVTFEAKCVSKVNHDSALLKIFWIGSTELATPSRLPTCPLPLPTKLHRST